jgi:hypothetical protein
MCDTNVKNEKNLYGNVSRSSVPSMDATDLSQPRYSYDLSNIFSHEYRVHSYMVPICHAYVTKSDVKHACGGGRTRSRHTNHETHATTDHSAEMMYNND